ncbi:MAG: LCP family protein, partial [Anaerovorax sp.]
ALMKSAANAKPLDTGSEKELDVELATLVDPKSPFFETFKDSKRVNVLLMGVNGGMTDTLMLASFDRDSKKLDVISVPRDTYYHRKGHDSLAENKINAAYHGDPVNAAYAVSDVLLGMPINYYAVIEYDGVKNIIDAMGGVPVNIPFDMDYDDPYDKPPLKIHFKEGPTVLKGEDVIKYLRYRKDDKPGYGYAEGDLGRVKAQQEFVKSAVKQCLTFQLPKVAKTVYKNVESDITLGTAVSLATKAIGMSAENMTTYMMPGYPEPESPYYVRPKEEEIAAMIEEIYAVDTETNTAAEGGISDSAVQKD